MRIRWDSPAPLLVYCNIASFFIVYKALLLVSGRSERIKIQSWGSKSYLIDYILIVKLFKIWLGLYIAQIIFCGGFPALWLINGDGRTYSEFGIPTVGGLLNALRSFCLTISFYYLYSNGKSVPNKKKVTCIVVLLLITAFIIEMSRGTGVVLFLHGVAVYLLIFKFNISKLIKLALLTIAILFLMGYIEMVRYGHDVTYLTEKYESIVGSESEGFQSIHVFSPIYFYIAVPVANLSLQIEYVNLFDFSPEHSLHGIVPTVIRNYLFPSTEIGEWGLLVNEAYNTSTFYSPLIRDYGIVGTFLFVVMLQVVVSFVHIRAQQGGESSRLFYPPLFMATVMSPFFMFYLYLMVMVFPVMAGLYIGKRYELLKKKQRRLRFQHPVENAEPYASRI